MARRGMAAHIAPSTRSGPLHELREETVFDWITRNNSPEKPPTPPVLAIATAAAKEKAPESVAPDYEGDIPEGTLR